MKKIQWGVMLAVGMVMLGLALAREQSVRAFCSPHMCEPENVLAGCNTGEKCVAYCCIEPTPGPSAGGGGGEDLGLHLWLRPQGRRLYGGIV